MPWYVFMAFKQLFPTGKRFSFFGLMAIIGVMLGVMVLIVVQTIMNGFSQKTKEMLHKVEGDIHIQSKEGVFENWQSIKRKVEQFNFVEAVSAYADGPVLALYHQQSIFPGLHGVNVDDEKKIIPLDKFMIQGNYEDLSDDSIILGSGLASRLNLKLGSKIDVFTPLIIYKLKKDEVILPRELKVVGIFKSGWTNLDESLGLVTLRLMQELFDLNKGVNGLTVKLKPGADLLKSEAEIQRSLPPLYTAVNRLKKYDDFFFVLKMEKTMMFFITIFIVLVASFSITSSLMTTVVKKTREIGLLSAMGGRSRHIAYCFCIQGLFIGIVGTFLGCIAAIAAIQYRNEIIHAMGRLIHRENITSNFYQFTDVPAYYMIGDFVIVTVCSILIVTLAGLFPALRAARLKPAEALRSE